MNIIRSRQHDVGSERVNKTALLADDDKRIILLTLTDEEKKFVPLITPSHILMFSSGAANVPSVGFDPTPSIVFVHDEYSLCTDLF